MNNFYSYKPFLLDSIISWCENNNLVPILITTATRDRLIPKHLYDQKDNNISFNLSNKAVFNKDTTDKGISFMAFFKNGSQIDKIFLPIESWVALKIKDTPHAFDFQFKENLNNINNIWPNQLDVYRYIEADNTDKSPEELQKQHFIDQINKNISQLKKQIVNNNEIYKQNTVNKDNNNNKEIIKKDNTKYEDINNGVGPKILKPIKENPSTGIKLVWSDGKKID